MEHDPALRLQASDHLQSCVRPSSVHTVEQEGLGPSSTLTMTPELTGLCSLPVSSLGMCFHVNILTVLGVIPRNVSQCFLTKACGHFGWHVAPGGGLLSTRPSWLLALTSSAPVRCLDSAQCQRMPGSAAVWSPVGNQWPCDAAAESIQILKAADHYS